MDGAHYEHDIIRGHLSGPGQTSGGGSVWLDACLPQAHSGAPRTSTLAPECLSGRRSPFPATQKESAMARVLIVDDDPDIRTTLRLLLEDEGYEVEERGDGLACLGALHASPNPLVVLLDYRMPHLNGDEVMRAVAAEGDLTARHAFVLLTASPR